MAEKTAIDAINDALGTAASGAPDPNAGVPDDETPVVETPPEGGTLEGEETPPEGEEAPEGEETPPEGEEKPEGDGTITTASAERNPDGTFKKKGEEPKKPDPINDPIPKELKQETKARMESLIQTAKTVTQERDQIKQDFDYMINGVQATGATPEQYGETLSWLALFNSNDPAQQEKALELVESVAERLATLLGKERSVGDPLAAHQDLKTDLAAGKITAQYAKEIARIRNSQGFRTELTTAAQTRQQQETTAQQVMTQARADLTALEENLRSVDGAEYEAIKAQIVGPLKPLMAAINPSQWKAKFTEAYKNAKEARAADKSSRQQTQQRVPQNQPLRGGKNPAGGRAVAPANPLEALNGALASMQK